MEVQNINRRIRHLRTWSRAKYILIYGICLYGVLLYFVYHSTLLMINMFQVEDFSLIGYLTDEKNVIRFLSSIILFALMGVYLSNSSWKNFMAKQKKERDN